MALLRSSLFVLVLLLCSGCVPFHSNGSTHYLIVGAGIVSVPGTNSVATATRADAVGLMATERGFKLGYGSESTVAIGTNENVVVEVKRSPFGSMTVTVPNLRQVTVDKKFNPSEVCVTPYR